jgi:hypothetical protein
MTARGKRIMHWILMRMMFVFVIASVALFMLSCSSRPTGWGAATDDRNMSNMSASELCVALHVSEKHCIH